MISMLSSSCGVNRRPSTVGIRGCSRYGPARTVRFVVQVFCVGRRLLKSELQRKGGARPRGVVDALKLIYDIFVTTNAKELLD